MAGKIESAILSTSSWKTAVPFPQMPGASRHESYRASQEETRMRENRIDKLVMLLSTDWFSEYWSTIGLFLMAQKKILVQIGCREIVQQILSGAKEYWSTSFSKERIEKTISMFQSMLEHSDIEKSTRERMNELISGKEESSLDTRTAWLLRSITQMIVTNSLG